MLKVWGRGSSFNVQKVLWLVGELGLSHRHIPAGGDHGGLDEPSFLAMNPHGRVPVIDDGGVMVWESHAILRYLAARYGGSEWWPASPVDRAQADGWMDWAQTALQRFPDGRVLGGIARRNLSATMTRSGPPSPHAPNISFCSTRYWLTDRSSAATSLAWPTFHAGRTSFATTLLRSTAQERPMSRHGTRVCRPVRLIERP